MMKPVLNAVFVVLALTGAAGCALVSPTNPYRAFGADQTEKSATSMPPSHTPVSGRPVTLREAIAVALKNNPALSEARYKADLAAAQRAEALSRALPSVHAVGGYTHYSDDQRLVGPRYNGELGVFGDDIFSADLVLTQPLFAGGRLVNEIKAATLLQQAAMHQFSRTRQELIFNVSSTFYAILAQRKVVASLRFSEKTLEEHLKQVESLIAQKRAARVDRLRTQVRIADVRQRLTQARNVLSVQRRVLANLMGVGDRKGPLRVSGTLAKTDEGPLVVEDKIKSAFEHRKDYLAARDALEAQAKKVDAARAGHWPTISLQGSYGMRWADNPTDYPTGTDASEELGRVGLFVDLPLFESGQIAARVREARATLGAFQERLRALKLRIRLEVETAALNIDTARKRIDTTEKAIAQAKESLRIEREKYNQGKGAMIDVLDAQSALLDSETNYFRALADYLTAIAQMRLATGEVK
ncbi:MAG: TolC family protein [Deltaproteobacteria bacterium]|nr:TolC family protein [Deltaproteobacteria bacterium]